jgi:hypothetical protein
MAPLFDSSAFVGFAVAAAALVAAPGPGQALLTRTFQGGARDSAAPATADSAPERLTGAVLVGLGVRLALLSPR